MKGHQEAEKENNERWLLTYSDLITLLLALFIILFSMSNVDKEKYRAVIESLGSVFGAAQGTGTGGNGEGHSGEINFPLFTPSSSFPVTPGAFPSLAPFASPLATSTPNNGGIGNAIEVEAMEYVQHQVEGLLTKEHLQNDVTVAVRQRGLVISINSNVLFASGSADLTPEAKAIVLKIANILTPLANNQICVEGHTDNVPIHTRQFPSNWELSLARANNVRDLLLTTNANLDPGKMAVIGYGEYREIDTNDTPEGRAKNRRVNIVILKDDFNKSIDINPAAAD
jgi:chemotaxis protein MotB